MEVDNETASLEVWNRETVPTVMKIVCSGLPQRDLISLLLVSPWVNRNLICSPFAMAGNFVFVDQCKSACEDSLFS